MTEEDTFYVGVNDSANLRKELLGCSKEAIYILKNYDKINSIRKDKIEKIIELQKILGEIKKLNNILRERLPSEKVRAKSLKTKKRVVKKTTIKKIIPNVVPKKQDNEIQQLEGELSEIENRLSNIGV
ncbi:hypothetical protein CEE44_03010 [Candidatus Woesearchaeota archaeon B3_Woes]|nr:MAG: hypothetical protein CEE44_03010 [Candidatus Woesearchaeota archaeon B3_Woes]